MIDRNLFKIDFEALKAQSQTSNEYLSLERGKRMKIRIFPPSIGYKVYAVPRNSYWLPYFDQDGKKKVRKVLQSTFHSDETVDLVEKYMEVGIKLNPSTKNVFDAPKDGIKLTTSYISYAAEYFDGAILTAKIFEYKKMLFQSINKLFYDEEGNETDYITDVDNGMPIVVVSNANPNRRMGEQYYEAMFPRAAQPRPLTDEELERFQQKTPLQKLWLVNYTQDDFVKEQECLKAFDEIYNLNIYEHPEYQGYVAERLASYNEEVADVEPTPKVERKEVKSDADFAKVPASSIRMEDPFTPKQKKLTIKEKKLLIEEQLPFTKEEALKKNEETLDAIINAPVKKTRLSMEELRKKFK